MKRYSSPEIQARTILRKIVPEEILPDQEDTKYHRTVLSWSQKEPEDYAVAIHEMQVQKGQELTDGFLKYLKRKGCWTPTLSETGDEGVYRYARFRLRLALPGLFALRFNGYALHPPQADTATCDLYGVTTVLPNFYAGGRYKGNVMTPGENIGPSGTQWSDTGYILATDMFRTGKDFRDRNGPTELYLIYNFTDEDAANGTAFNVSNEERSKTVLKLEGSPRNVLVPIHDELGVPSPGVSVTPESYHEPEIIKLGIDGPFHRCKPIPLFPESGS